MMQQCKLIREMIKMTKPKSNLTITVDSDLLEMVRYRFPGQISEIFNEYLKVKLCHFKGENLGTVEDVEKELEQVLNKEKEIHLRVAELTAKKQILSEEHNKKKKEEELKKIKCKACGFIKDEAELKAFSGICKSCFLTLTGEELKKYM